MSERERTRLAVLGSPIRHSKSPAIQLAAYRVLGLDWRYEAIELTGAGLAEFLRSCGPQWRGLSLTMPLKRDILPLLDIRERLVDLVGGANTVLFTDEGIAGWNTDVYGIVQALRESGVASADSAQVLGSGASAASVIAALAELGGTRATVFARTPARAQPLVGLGTALGVAVTVHPYQMKEIPGEIPGIVVSTVPGGADVLHFAAEVRREAVLLDIAYDPWPSELASAWGEVGGTVVSGVEMLIHQALAQVRIFLAGDPAKPLPREVEVLTAMRAAAY